MSLPTSAVGTASFAWLAVLGEADAADQDHVITSVPNTYGARRTAMEVTARRAPTCCRCGVRQQSGS